MGDPPRASEANERAPGGLSARRLASVVGLALILGALVLGITLAATVSSYRAFQVDEVEHLHAAYNLRDGRLIYRDFWQGHNPLLYLALLPFVDVDDPVVSFARGRLVLLVSFAAMVGVVGACGWRLGGAPAAGLAAGLALFHTTLVERGIEVRPDGPLGLCIAGALLIELAGRPRGSWRPFVQGVLLGLGLLLTQKAVFAAALFGGWWVLRSLRTRDPRPALAGATGAVLPLGLAAIGLAVLGVLDEYVQANVTDAWDAMRGAEHRARFSPWRFLVQEGSRNLVFWGVVAAGAVRLGLATWRGRRGGQPARGFALLLGAWLLGTLFLQPFPWPYVHVSVLPVLAVVAAAALPSRRAGEAGEGAGGAARWVLVAVLVALAAISAFPRLVSKSVPDTGYQFATLRRIQEVTPPDAPVFDMVGLYFRPDAYPHAYAMSGDLFRWYTLGGFPPMIDSWRERGLAAVILNYRTSWLEEPEIGFLRERFVHYWGNVLLPGRDVTAVASGAEVPFEVLRDHLFRWEGTRGLSVDGRPFAEGPLRRGWHRLRLEGEPAGPERLIVAVPRPADPLPPQRLYTNFD